MKPPKLKGHSVVTASQGLILYGGITWPDVDMEISDLALKQRNIFLDQCEKIVE